MCSKEGEEDEDEDEEGDVMPFSCVVGPQQSHIHTHAPIHNLLYHLGRLALVGEPHLMSLAPFAIPHWTALIKKETRQALSTLPVIKIRIPAGKLKGKSK